MEPLSRRTVLIVASAGLTVLMTTAPVHAGNGNIVGAGLLGLGIGAIIGSALTPTEVYVAPPPAYGPPAWTPAWYRYCRAVHGPYFDPRSGYFEAADGGFYFCQ
jgi:hypothetical protein